MLEENPLVYNQVLMKDIKELIKQVEKGIRFSSHQRLEKEMASVLFGTMVSATSKKDVNSSMRSLHPVFSRKSVGES